jgi:Domain of unknown function (DUF6487)
MGAETTRCPKCNGEMAQGFIFDYHAGGKRLVSTWVEGAPEKSFCRVTKIPAEKCLPVGVFRCSGCGFLESYARPEFAAK